MIKFLIVFFVLCVFSLSGAEVKKEIASCLEKLEAAESEYAKGEIHCKLASAYFNDQEMDKAFQHFLLALKSLPAKQVPEISEEENALYETALADYLNGAGSDPAQLAKNLLNTYGRQAEDNPNWIHLNFLVSTAYANLGQYDTFFERFYQAYPYLSETSLAYKTRGVLYLRLSHRESSVEERRAYQKEAFSCLTCALDRNLKDASLYKVLIFLAKDEKNDALVFSYLQKMVENEAHISRGDIYLYVCEAVALGEPGLGQRIIDLARTQYDFSRAISAAQEFLNQYRG